jgi:hypothetical protein
MKTPSINKTAAAVTIMDFLWLDFFAVGGLRGAA